MTDGKRLIFIDAARSFAVFLALFAHTLNSANIFKQLGSNSLYIKQFTMMATPMFVFMFGFMIEYVYTRRAQANGIQAIYRRVFVRSFQCYVAYALTALSSYLGGYLTFTSFLNALLFLENSNLGNILRAYAVLMLVLPLLLSARIKLGRQFSLISLIIVLFSFPLLERFEHLTFGQLNNLVNVLLGLGPKMGGPSVYHCLSFMLAGMYLAASLKPAGARVSMEFYRSGSILLAVAATGLYLSTDDSIKML